MDAMLRLNVGGRGLAPPNLMLQTFLTPHERPYPIGRVDGGWAGREARRAGKKGGKVNCGCNVK